MIPYTDLLYFGVLLYVTVPTLVARLTTRLWRACILTATAGMLIIQYYPRRLAVGSGTVRELWLVVGFALMQWAIARTWLAVQSRINRRVGCIAAVSLALLPLVLSRVLPLFAPTHVWGFLGLSYVTFRSLDVILGIHDRLITALPPDQYLAYLLFFPTISSGPVDRYRRFAQDWGRSPTRDHFWQDVDQGVHHILTGFLYKFILAALIKRYWLDVADSGTTFLHTVSYMYAYSFYLFFDFAGYSAFAIGLSHLFGIHTPQNFSQPFLAPNIREFWNRWHISLSWWFRDHIYARFTFAAMKGRWFRNKYIASYLGFLLSMGLMGLWHGTAWHFVLYGLYHAALLVGHDFWVRENKRRQLIGNAWYWRAASVALTFHLVCFGLLIFSGRLG